MSTLLKLIVALAAFAILAWLCISHDAPRIEADVRANVAAGMAADLGDEVTLDVSGRDVLLSGTVVSENVANRLVTTASAATGVRRVVNGLEVAAALPVEPYATRVAKSAAGLQVSGTFPNAEMREELLGELSANDATLDDSSTAREAPPAGWREVMAAGTLALAGLESGVLDVIDDRLTLTGVAATADQRAAALALLASIDDQQLNVQVDLAPPPPVAVVEAQVQSCQARFDEQLAGEKVLFATSSATIDPTSQALLRDLAQIVQDCPNVSVEIAGHTDSRGDPAYNQALSVERANAVRDALLALGISGNRLTSAGYGASRPRATNDTAAGREENRRIELTVTTP